MIKNKKGITMIALVMTVAILLILSSVTIFSINSVPKIQEITKMKSDIELLKNKVLVYYNKYGSIPTEGGPRTKGQIPINQIDTNDGPEYYEIDINKLENVTLNYGDRSIGANDVYIINAKTLKVYYLRGVQLLGTVYHTET